MGISNPIWRSPGEYLRLVKPDTPALFFSPENLLKTAHAFQSGFPGMVSYAVKANPTGTVLETLKLAGVSAFDVASPVEVDLLKQHLPDAVLHYHNPVRSTREIEYALDAGVRVFSVDRMSELEKLSASTLDRNIEISVRLSLPVSGAAYHFGDKFGASPSQCAAILKRVNALGMNASMTFHPGTQCTDPNAWARYIRECAAISQSAGIRLNRLNIGGGFPASRTAKTPTLALIFATIKAAARDAFANQTPDLVCEPGRAMVADSFLLATRIKALGRAGEVFLNDGIYGGLAELPSIGVPEGIRVLDGQGKLVTGDTEPRKVFGPTCDSLDVLPSKIALPRNMSEDDYVLFPSTGAYGAALATRFNGYGAHKTIPVAQL